MLAPKQPKPSRTDEKQAYQWAAERDKGVCCRCRSTNGVQIDHRRNRSQGGLTVLSNIQTLCLGCHLWKTDHPADANRQGWGCPGWADPQLYPAARILRSHNGWYVRYLNEPFDDGVRKWWVLVPPAEAAEWFATVTA
jgi:hypothetical protein